MIERLILACTVTLSLYLFLQLGGKPTAPTQLGENLRTTPAQSISYLVDRR
ncbi:hypothetical protein [Oscillatoria salina]|uniref:hypothetical protein n=1 Tax=Oscillatoria salina TaxID=331517 RepID=UPI0013B87F5A|nr:hypothetical protein [Oscillatoria salina]MBZ8182879.1 hypothetical protein [Oscillatoria salina IIICB1]NET89572.1 hypothetical protein [Kamptonema sp. SIO1D9]